MNQNAQTQDTTTARGQSLGRRFAVLLEGIRTRQANQSELARQIAAYPAQRSVSTLVLPY